MASLVFRLVLIVMTTFLELTGFAGGIGLIADLNAPPLEMLEGSVFRNYIVPGLALFVIVGGTASVAEASCGGSSHSHREEVSR